MTDQVFELENYRGPLDLLLHLVREQEMEITEVNLAALCDQYLVALEAMRKLDIDVAGEFLVVASTLMLIKSRSILPREDVNLAEELDPADELIMQLLEYRRFKTLSMELGQRAIDRSQRFARGSRELPPDEERELAEIDMWDLVGIYARLVEELDLNRRFDTLAPERPMGAFILMIVQTLSDGRDHAFRDLLLSTGSRDDVFGLFFSILELMKLQQIKVKQKQHGDEITVNLRPDRDESLVAGLIEAVDVRTHHNYHGPDGEQPEEPQVSESSDDPGEPGEPSDEHPAHDALSQSVPGAPPLAAPDEDSKV